MDSIQYSSSDDDQSSDRETRTVSLKDSHKSESKGSRKSPEHRRERHSSPYHSHNASSWRYHGKSVRHSKSKDLSHHRDEVRRSKRRSRSRSRSPRRRHSRDKSPKRRSRSKERSTPPPRKTFDPKNKLYILAKMGIDYKVPEVDKASNPSSSGLPSYYNPLTVNAGKYAEQIAKRKLLWNNKKANKDEGESAPTNSNIWQGAKFSQDADGKLAAKFQRLMGMKERRGDGNLDPRGKDLNKKQEELFSSMEMQYEVARATTHTQRGVGLGFGPRHIP